MATRLEQRLAAGEFAVTAEVCPPKGCDCGEFLARSRALAPFVDAINVTDNQGANMRISPLAAASLLAGEGIEPVLQLTCRDRNRLALQSDLLGAAALGIGNVLALTGDHITCGDHREGKPVFDLDAVQLLGVMQRLADGFDLAGRRLHGAPSFFAGAAAAPEAEPLAPTLGKLRQKAAAGARFVQTQAIFRPERLERFGEAADAAGVRVIAGILLLKSAAMARYINAHIPGLRVPDEIVAELEQSPDPSRTGLDIARRLAVAVRPLCHGVHVMAMGREEIIPDIIQEVR